VNHPTKTSEINAMCHLIKYLEGTCSMTHVRDFFRVYHRLLFSGFGASGFLSFRLMRTSKARKSEVTVRDLCFKTREAPKLKKLLGSLDQINGTHQ
jgi:hypothetical protein